MHEKIETYRRLRDRLNYIKGFILTMFGLSTLSKVAEKMGLYSPTVADNVAWKYSDLFIVIAWSIAMVAFIVLSEAVVRVNSKIRTMEHKLDERNCPSKYRRTFRKSRGIAPPRS